MLRTTESRSRRVTEVLGSVSRSQHFSIESAVLPSQVEQLPDLTGYLKYASDPTWLRVRLDAKSAWNAAKTAPIAAANERAQRSFAADHE